MKSTKLVHPSHARTVLSEDDAARLRQAGWLEFEEAKPVSKVAARQRQYRTRCKKLGYRLISVWLPEDVDRALTAARMPRESVAELIERLLKKLSLL